MDQSAGIANMTSHMGVVPTKPMIVAVDGPAGSGKSTVCQQVCQALEWSYVNTGSVYRAVGLLAEEQDVDIQDAERMRSIVKQFEDVGRWQADEGRLFIGERDLTPMLGGSLRGKLASCVATHPQVRQDLLPVFRSLVLKSQARGVLVDGRDIGSVVFPEADLKIYMTASLDVRARRRLLEMKVAESEFEHIKQQIQLRDHQDLNRKVAPLVQAEGAVVFDTTLLDQNAVASGLQQLIQERLLSKQ